MQYYGKEIKNEDFRRELKGSPQREILSTRSQNTVFTPFSVFAKETIIIL